MKRDTVWCICHINNKFSEFIKRDLKEKGYDDIRIYIPMVSILKKRSKGKDIYEQVPMLFSYGFIRIPRIKAYNRSYLYKMKRDIPGILTWVKSLDHIKKKIKKRIDNTEDWDDFSIVASVSKKDIRRFKRISRENLLYSNHEIAQLEIGSYIVLKGYPYDGVSASIEEVNLLEKMVKVMLYPEGGKIETWLPFSNVLYSVYQDYDPNKLNCNEYNDQVVNNMDSEKGEVFI